MRSAGSRRLGLVSCLFALVWFIPARGDMVFPGQVRYPVDVVLIPAKDFPLYRFYLCLNDVEFHEQPLRAGEQIYIAATYPNRFQLFAKLFAVPRDYPIVFATSDAYRKAVSAGEIRQIQAHVESRDIRKKENALSGFVRQYDIVAVNPELGEIVLELRSSTEIHQQHEGELRLIVPLACASAFLVAVLGLYLTIRWKRKPAQVGGRPSKEAESVG
jgi:hypothetical protein